MPAVDLEDTREGTGERGEEERDDREAAPRMTDASGTSEGAEHRNERKDRENRDRDDRGAEEGAYRAVRLPSQMPQTCRPQKIHPDDSGARERCTSA